MLALGQSASSSFGVAESSRHLLGPGERHEKLRGCFSRTKQVPRPKRTSGLQPQSGLLDRNGTGLRKTPYGRSWVGVWGLSPDQAGPGHKEKSWIQHWDVPTIRWPAAMATCQDGRWELRAGLSCRVTSSVRLYNLILNNDCA